MGQVLLLWTLLAVVCAGAPAFNATPPGVIDVASLAVYAESVTDKVMVLGYDTNCFECHPTVLLADLSGAVHYTNVTTRHPYIFSVVVSTGNSMAAPPHGHRFSHLCQQRAVL